MNRTSSFKQGFTLIEVLIALAIVAIAFAALLKSTAQSVSNTEKIKEKTISHWVAMQGVTMIQLGLVTLHPNQEVTERTTMFNQHWYWRAKLIATENSSIQQIYITTSKQQTGPFKNLLIAYRYVHE